MQFLFVLDPIEKLDLKWDTSLTVLRELHKRGHKNWAADVRDFWAEGKNVFVRARNLIPEPIRGDSNTNGTPYRYLFSSARMSHLDKFKLVFIRKDPPFDSSYLYLTYMLDRVAERIPVINHPQGIRDTNEKLSILQFSRWIPETLVASSPEPILKFQQKIQDDLVIKPLDEKGGKGVFLLRGKETGKRLKLEMATEKGKKFILAQRFLHSALSPGEKRIFILNGKFAGAYEKRPAPGDFRANLSLVGSTFQSTSLTRRENQLASEVGGLLLKKQIYFAGLDVLNEKLIEINVTSPAGITEIMALQPESRLVQKVADFLETCVRRR